MCKIFSWDKNTEVIIYGAATQGGLVYNNIADQCNVIGFFDKRSAEIKNYLGLPVYLSDTNVFSFEKKKQLLVIVAIRNIFEHGSLVNVLVILGYENILFKPADNSIYKNDNIESQTFLSSLYDKVSNKYKL
jgi:FlaA1/EpsC-like NDP-sugar epimerase